MKIGIIGAGYVGLVTGACFAEMGNDVICMDTDPHKINLLKDGISPIYEPGLEAVIRTNLSEGRLMFTTDICDTVKRCQIIFITVGTPSDKDGSADLGHVFSVAAEIAKFLDGYRVIVNKSTVPVGTAVKVRELLKAGLAERKVEFEFDVVSNPEFLREGTAISDFMRPDRIVIGSDNDRACKLMRRLYEPFVRNGHPVYFMDTSSSELTKYAANAMLATKISFMNEIANLCEKMGGNVDNVRIGIGSDPRIGMPFLYAGLGYGGSCLPKDVMALIKMANDVGIHFSMLSTVDQINNQQKKKLFHQIDNYYNGRLYGLKIAVWGLSFKPDTDDMRDAPSFPLINSLLDAGAQVIAYDPVAMTEAKRHFGPRSGLTFAEKQYDAVRGTDCLCLVTEWKSFREPDFDKMKSLMKSTVIFDGRNQYHPDEMTERGFVYFSIGRAPRSGRQ